MHTYDFQAPKDDTYKNFESTKVFFRRYFLLFPVALYALYNLTLVKKNKYSERYEIKFGSRWVENTLVAEYLNRKIGPHIDGKVYKQDT